MNAVAEKLVRRIEAVNSLLCVGLDPDFEKLPQRYRGHVDPQQRFGEWIVDQTAEYAAAIKLNAAFYEARGAEGIRGFDDEGVRGAFADGPGEHAPDVIQGARRERHAGAHSTRARRIRARKAPPRPAPDEDEEHFIPPAPPPLPKLDPITKGAWAALFGGPGYLVVATVAGWSVPGIAAFCAVAAFVTGFAILVLRMNAPGSGGPDDDGDDGAVV